MYFSSVQYFTLKRERGALALEKLPIKVKTCEKNLFVKAFNFKNTNETISLSLQLFFFFTTDF